MLNDCPVDPLVNVLHKHKRNALMWLWICIDDNRLQTSTESIWNIKCFCPPIPC